MQFLPFLELENLETKAVLKKAASANRYLAELKGVVLSIPNEAILINTLALQEAKHSSEIENIVTTHDDLFKSDITQDNINLATKEVQNYREALLFGFFEVRTNKIIRLNDILHIQQLLERNKAGFRKVSGTTLKDSSGNIIYTPPQHPDEITSLMANLVEFINDDSLSELDPLIKMAIIHHQFESIHPFYDGNGRTGRILNMLYLVIQGLLDLPVLYLSHYLIHHKSEYYQYIQEVRDTGNWENWLLYMLDGVEKTAISTIELVKEIKALIQIYKHKMRTEKPKIYQQELLNNLFNHPYTKIEFVMNDLEVTRKTASKYLDELVEIGLLEKEKIGRSAYYINRPLFNLFLNRN
ncbi:MAG: Fic family protein [Moraxella sp.]|uniref:Fic family protein n=1 Tax=Moraxella sp. TaxID=479 RepID=UPI0026DBA849|nr:Fic family protein [Moraxella sp.]MDO4450130.1 Fic family protein [Moraxella sp.]